MNLLRALQAIPELEHPPRMGYAGYLAVWDEADGTHAEMLWPSWDAEARRFTWRDAELKKAQYILDRDGDARLVSLSGCDTFWRICTKADCLHEYGNLEDTEWEHCNDGSGLLFEALEPKVPATDEGGRRRASVSVWEAVLLAAKMPFLWYLAVWMEDDGYHAEQIKADWYPNVGQLEFPEREYRRALDILRRDPDAVLVNIARCSSFPEVWKKAMNLCGADRSKDYGDGSGTLFGAILPQILDEHEEVIRNASENNSEDGAD